MEYQFSGLVIIPNIKAVWNFSYGFVKRYFITCYIFWEVAKVIPREIVKTNLF